MKKVKIKNSIFDGPLIVIQTFSQIEFIIDKSDFAHIITHIHWTKYLKILAIKRSFPFNFAKVLQGRHFVVVWQKTFKLLPDASFDSGFQKIVLATLMLFSCAFY